MHFKTAIVIGNGFDLDYRLKTSYTSFVNDTSFPASDLATFVKNSFVNKGWADLEADIKKYAIEEKYSGIPQFRADFEQMKNALFSFLKKVESGDIVEQKQNAFARHLFKGARDYVVLDFNYTQIVPYSWINGAHGPGVPMINERLYINVHGTLENKDIIFGIEDIPIADDLKFLLKSSAPNYKRTDVVNYMSQAQQVIIWGHSLGMSDKDYFMAYFNQIMTDKAKSKKIVIVTNDEKSTIQIKDNIKRILDCDYKLLEDMHRLKFIQTKNLIEEQYDAYMSDIWGW